MYHSRWFLAGGGMAGRGEVGPRWLRRACAYCHRTKHVWGGAGSDRAGEAGKKGSAPVNSSSFSVKIDNGILWDKHRRNYSTGGQLLGWECWKHCWCCQFAFYFVQVVFFMLSPQYLQKIKYVSAIKLLAQYPLDTGVLLLWSFSRGLHQVTGIQKILEDLRGHPSSKLIKATLQLNRILNNNRCI